MEPGFYTPEKDLDGQEYAFDVVASMEPGFYTPEKPPARRGAPLDAPGFNGAGILHPGKAGKFRRRFVW